MPPSSMTASPSRAWPAALAGAWPITTPTGILAAATASPTTACWMRSATRSFLPPSTPARKPPRSPSDVVLEVSSAMALGDLPGGVPAGLLGLHQRRERAALPATTISSAEFAPRPPRPLRRPSPTRPSRSSDFVGLAAGKIRGASTALPAPQVAARSSNEMRLGRAWSSRPSPRRGCSPSAWAGATLLRMYYKYIGVLGCPTSVYRFEAVWHGRAVRTVIQGAGAVRPAGMHRIQPHPHRRPHLGLRRRPPAGHRPERQPPALLRRGRAAAAWRAPSGCWAPPSSPCGAAWQAPTLPPPARRAGPPSTAKWRERWMLKPPSPCRRRKI